MQAGVAGKQARDSRLTRAGGSPEDHRAKRTGRDHARQCAVFARQMLLADDLAEILRPQAIRERPAGQRSFPLGLAEQIGHQ